MNNQLTEQLTGKVLFWNINQRLAVVDEIFVWISYCSLHRDWFTSTCEQPPAPGSVTAVAEHRPTGRSPWKTDWQQEKDVYSRHTPYTTIWYDEFDSSGLDPAEKQKYLDQFQVKMNKTKEQIKREQLERDSNVDEYLRWDIFITFKNIWKLYKPCNISVYQAMLIENSWIG